MHSITVNPTHIARRTQCCVCAAALCTRLEKCEYDGALLVSARIATQLQGGLGSPKMPHSRVARKSLDSPAPKALIHLEDGFFICSINSAWERVRGSVVTTWT